jgi:hypothetical protein
VRAAAEQEIDANREHLDAVSDSGERDTWRATYPGVYLVTLHAGEFPRRGECEIKLARHHRQTLMCAR